MAWWPAAEEPVQDVWDGDDENATFADVRKYGIGSTNWDGSLPLSTTGEKLELGVLASSVVTDYDTNKLSLWLEEVTGLDLVFKVFAGSGSDMATQLGLMFTGGEKTPDIVHSASMGNAAKGEYVREGYLANVAGYYITDSCENVQLAWRFMDFMCSPEANMRQRWGEKGVDWDWIEDTEFKDKAKGNSIYGNDAAFVVHKVDSMNIKWNNYMGCWTERNPQMFSDPDNPDFINSYYKRAARNVLMQKEIGQPEDQLLVFSRTPEEDERFGELYPDINYYFRMYRDEFCMGYKDPNDDAQWNEYVEKMKGIGLEDVIEIAQQSFDRQKAEMEAYVASLEK